MWEEAATRVTLKMMLNQTSGFGMEFLSGVQDWKKCSGKGTGFVNSCKVVSLILSSYRSNKDRDVLTRCLPSG